MENRDLVRVVMKPIGLVRRTSADEDVKDKGIVSRVVLDKDLSPALDGIADFSHVFVIYWLHHVVRAKEPVLRHPGRLGEAQPVGIFATRAPIHPNPIGLTLVELVKREGNTLWVKGLDAHDGTPVLDVKPYPDWERGRLIVVTDFRIPEWLRRIVSPIPQPPA
jgi:tRNA-Thr(GGU) m(6)t(6)A37 methyltransferase TsaA